MKNEKFNFNGQIVLSLIIFKYFFALIYLAGLKCINILFNWDDAVNGFSGGHHRKELERDHPEGTYLTKQNHSNLHQWEILDFLERNHRPNILIDHRKILSFFPKNTHLQQTHQERKQLHESQNWNRPHHSFYKSIHWGGLRNYNQVIKTKGNWSRFIE